MKLQGKIKTIMFKSERVSVLLEDARIFTADQRWEPYLDVELVKDGKYKKGETWLSSFNEPIYQACRELSKGAEVEVGVIISERGFKNIQSIGLKLPEVDVNEDMPPKMVVNEDIKEENLHQPLWPKSDEPFPNEETAPGEETPSSTQRDADSPEAQAERMLKEEAEEERASNKLDKRKQIEMPEKDRYIIRECCVKAVGNGMRLENENDAEVAVAIAKRLEKYVLEGK